MGIRRMTLVAVVPVVFGLAACGGNGTDGDGVASAGGAAAKASASPTQSLSPEEARLKFAQCMRQHGVDMPDPDDSGRVQIRARKGDQQKTQAAMKACQHFMQAGGRLGNPDDPKVRDRMLKFAQCMREHGVDMPDPKPGEGIQLRMNKGSQAKVEAAQKACEQYAPGGGDKGGTSVGGTSK